MSKPQDWRDSLTFSDRLSRMQNFERLFQGAGPDAPPETVRLQASNAEQKKYEEATSLEEYHDHSLPLVFRIFNDRSLRRAELEKESTISKEAELSSAAPLVSVGPYKDALEITTTLSSTIFKANSLANPDAVVALKVTQPAREPAPHNSVREAAILKTLSHPSIIPLLSAERISDGQFLLEFSYLPINLEEYLDQNLAVSLRNKLRILKALFSALAYLHSLEIIHRDVKPSNILLSENSPRTDVMPIFLIDFGTAWSPTLSVPTEPPDQKITDVGTTAYRPPELLFAYSRYTTALDLWAAGCVSYEVLRAKTLASPMAGERGQLFDSGELGSELALISSQFRTLGTPTDETWPEAAQMETWGKMEFTEFPGKPWEEIMPKNSSEDKDFVSRLVVFESGRRMTAEEALNHPLLKRD